MDKEYLSFKEAAKYLGVSPLTIRRRVQAGELHAVKNGINAREKLVAVKDLDALKEVKPVEAVKDDQHL